MENTAKQEWIKLNLQRERQTESAQAKWAKYYDKEYSAVIKLGNYYFPIRKPEIKKDFCFGCGQNGVSTQEEWENAFKMQDYANSNVNYFLNENLGSMNEEIKMLELYLDANMDVMEFHKLLEENNIHCYRYGKYYIYSSSYVNNYQVDYTIYDEYRDELRLKKWLIREATKEDITNILNALKAEKEKFVKRLNTYLKRYGLSKLHTWTYLVD